MEDYRYHKLHSYSVVLVCFRRILSRHLKLNFAVVLSRMKFGTFQVKSLRVIDFRFSVLAMFAKKL